MCGIAGWIRQDDEKLSKDEVKKILIELESRGKDATGIAWYDGKEVVILKSPGKASDFVKLKLFKKSLKSICSARWALLHTRQATSGEPQYNRNNHPIYTKDGMIIHNGIVTPDEQLPADSVNDSEQILRAIEKWGLKGLNKLTGSMAIAYVDFARPWAFYLYRNYAPIETAYKGSIFLFCSTDRILKRSIDGIDKPKSLEAYRVFKVKKNGITRLGKYGEGKFASGYQIWYGGKVYNPAEYYANFTADTRARALRPVRADTTMLDIDDDEEALAIGEYNKDLQLRSEIEEVGKVSC